MRAVSSTGPATKTSAPIVPATPRSSSSTSTPPWSPTSSFWTPSSPSTTPPPSTARARTGARSTARLSSSTRPSRTRRPAPKSTGSPPKAASNPGALSPMSSPPSPSGAPRSTTSAISKSAARQAATSRDQGSRVRAQGSGVRDQGSGIGRPLGGKQPQLALSFLFRRKLSGLILRPRLVDPQARDPPHQDDQIHGAIGVDRLLTEGHDALGRRPAFRRRRHGQAMQRPFHPPQHHHQGQSRQRRRPRADHEPQRMAPPARLVPAPEQNHKQTQPNRQQNHQQVCLLRRQLHQPQRCHVRVGGQRLPCRPRSQHGCHYARHRQQPHAFHDPQRTFEPVERTPRQLHQHQHANQSHCIRQRGEDRLQRELRHPPGELPARQHLQGNQHNAHRKPGKAPRPVPPQQNRQQHQKRRKGQRPENLNGGELKIEAHFLPCPKNG